MLPGSLFGLPLVTSGGGRCTCPVFGELPIAHQVVGQVYQADLHLSPRQANGADEFPPHAVFLEVKDVLDTGADLGARAVVRLLLVGRRLVALTFLANVTLSNQRSAGLPPSPHCDKRCQPIPPGPGYWDRRGCQTSGCHAHAPGSFGSGG